MSTAFGLRKERWLREHWPAIRAAGLLRFVLVRGLLTWGGMMSAAVAIMLSLRLGVEHPRLPLLLVIAIPLCAIGGMLWSAVGWWINERLFRSLTSE